MIDDSSTLEDVCFAVATALQQIPVDAVLTGGSAATIYAPDAYTSADADFVLQYEVPSKDIVRALASIGFHPAPTRGMFEHPRCTFTVDFPKGPLAIGREYVRDTAVLSRGDLSLRILTPTDCVKDRLAHFFYWDDDTAFNAAVGVATSQRANIDVTELARWTHSESTGGVDFRPKLKRFFRTAGIERSAE